MLTLASLRAASTRMLVLWFGLWSVVRIWQLGFLNPGPDLSWFGRDFRIYRDAALALLSGSDPYAAFDRWNGTDWHYAAPPSAAQLFVPFALVPEPVGFAVFTLAGVVLTLATLRRLGLPVWWLLFPPLMEGLGAGNPHLLVLPLLVLGAGPARAVAVALKTYALAPVLGGREWRALGAVVALTVASVAVSPAQWASYAGRFGEISGRLTREAAGGVSATLVLDPSVFGSAVTPPVATALGVVIFLCVLGVIVLAAARDVRAAAWVAVPLAWPAAQYPYASFAIPIARRVSTWIIAIPTIPTYLVGLLVLAYEVAAARPSLANGPAPVSLRGWFGHRTARAAAMGGSASVRYHGVMAAPDDNGNDGTRV